MDVEENVAGEAVPEGEDVPEGGDLPEGGNVEGQEKGESEAVEGEHVKGEEAEHVEGEHHEGEEVAGEHVEGEHVAGEHAEGEEKSEPVEGAEQVLGEGEELMGEGLEETGEEEQKEAEPVVEDVEEEEVYVEPPPPDPAAPYNFSDSQEALKPLYELRPDQQAEVEQLWETYQNYTPAYSDIKDYITEKELIYMLKSLMLMTFTPEQLEELIEFCVRPPHPDGHITYPQFLKMVTLRQRDFNIEEELREALQILDPDKTNSIDREYFKEVLSEKGHKMSAKQLDYLVKEVDITNDGTIGIDDVVGTMCVDLNTDDIIMLRNQLFPGQGAGAVDVDED